MKPQMNNSHMQRNLSSAWVLITWQEQYWLLSSPPQTPALPANVLGCVAQGNQREDVHGSCVSEKWNLQAWQSLYHTSLSVLMASMCSLQRMILHWKEPQRWWQANNCRTECSRFQTVRGIGYLGGSANFTVNSVTKRSRGCTFWGNKSFFFNIKGIDFHNLCI